MLRAILAWIEVLKQMNLCEEFSFQNFKHFSAWGFSGDTCGMSFNIISFTDHSMNLLLVIFNQSFLCFLSLIESSFWPWVLFK
jgi:hypothetical protein